MVNPPPSHYPDIGTLGEDLVAQWLESNCWMILHRRFSSRWGEIDIIAQQQDKKDNFTLAFVEVKTRSQRNWDAGGKSAITPQKQAKICRTAQMFLAEYPQKADYACRFDVAIVKSERISPHSIGVINNQKVLASFSDGIHRLSLEEYIKAAFDAIDNG